MAKEEFEVVMLLANHVVEMAMMEANATEFGWNEIQIRDSVQSDHSCYKLLLSREVGVAEKPIIGYCILQVVGCELELLNIVIAKEFQCRGYARLFLAHLLKFKIYSEMTAVWLEVCANYHAARSLYKNLGFSVVSERRGYYSRLGNKEDALIMRYQLPISDDQ